MSREIASGVLLYKSYRLVNLKHECDASFHVLSMIWYRACCGLDT
jgi:hypothetical protein